MNEVVLETALLGVSLRARGKVRDIYDLGAWLLIVATDRISAFDCILPTGIPDKGRILTSMSLFWFDRMRDIVPNHLLPAGVNGPAAAIPEAVQEQWPSLEGRSMLVRKASPFPVECVARGYLAGSAWKEYRENSHPGRLQDGRVPCAGVLLPPGLSESCRLPEPVFTPSTKAESGHDEPITFSEMETLVGTETAALLRDFTLRIYARACEYAAGRGVIIADTKLEFGQTQEGVILIDEVLTPDSSRFWEAGTYQPGGPQPSFDKQFVRDYLETLDWDKTPPAPPLPPAIAERTAEKYREAHRRITGRELA